MEENTKITQFVLPPTSINISDKKYGVENQKIQYDNLVLLLIWTLKSDDNELLKNKWGGQHIECS